MTDRAWILAQIADEYVRSYQLPFDMPEGCTSIRVEVWPEWTITDPRELRFSAQWPDITLICSRPFPARLRQMEIYNRRQRRWWNRLLCCS